MPMQRNMKFSDQTVWITGASSGIGAALAVAFAEKGARLVLSSRRRAQLEAIQKQCADPARVFIYPLDVADFEAVQKVATTVLAEVGPIDIVINNAGISQRSLVAETTLAVDQRIMDVNYFGTIALTKALLPSMIERQSGTIVAISSVMGKVGTPVRSAYAASKHALHGFFDSLRAEVADHGIKVCVICPGYVQTQVSLNALTGDGTPFKKMSDGNAKGLTPAAFAQKAIRAIGRQRSEVYIGGFELIAIYLRRFFPSLWFWVVRQVKVT
jgi:dehydrogenase/reductase SDR family protein 7B